jgi:hypothetical protein
MKVGKIAIAAGIVLIAATAWGQGRKPFTPEEKRQNLVSASAGDVNYAEGDVKVKTTTADWGALANGDTLKNGDSVRTGPGARAEILLNPGSYVRLSGDTEFRFDDTSLDNLRFRVLKGSAIVEAAAVDGSSGRLATVITPNDEFPITRHGVYRFDVDGGGKAQVTVEKGSLLVSGVQVKEGKRASVGGGAPVVASFKKSSRDQFDTWSEERATTLVAANHDLQYRPSFFSSIAFLRFPFRRCQGLWLFDPFINSFIFLPEAFDSCSPFFSPYGYTYGVCNPYSYGAYGLGTPYVERPRYHEKFPFGHGRGDGGNPYAGTKAGNTGKTPRSAPPWVRGQHADAGSRSTTGGGTHTGYSGTHTGSSGSHSGFSGSHSAVSGGSHSSGGISGSSSSSGGHSSSGSSSSSHGK